MAKIQSVLFNIADYTKEEARSWLKEHKIKPIKYDEIKSYHRFKIRDESLFDDFIIRDAESKLGPIEIILGLLES